MSKNNSQHIVVDLGELSKSTLHSIFSSYHALITIGKLIKTDPITLFLSDIRPIIIPSLMDYLTLTNYITRIFF